MSKSKTNPTAPLSSDGNGADPTSDGTGGDDLALVRRRLRDLYAAIEAEPLPPGLEAFAERLDREGTCDPSDDEA